jgi:putative flippase GtrA
MDWVQNFCQTYIRDEKARFIVVGAIGFVVNFLGLALFFDVLRLPIAIAQIVSVELAILATFVGNNSWAFSGHRHIPLGRKIWRFHASAVTGMAINSVVVIILVRFFDVHYGLSLAAGSLAGLTWNYTLYKHFVFKTTPPKDSK